MKHFLVVVLVFFVSLPGAAEPNFGPERIAYLQTDRFEKPLHVWLPKNYDAKRKWPVLFFYHGTGGAPTIEFLRMYTDNSDWVLIGMTYLQPGQFQFSDDTLEDTMRILHEVRDEVAEDVSIDLEKVYVSGFSKGGWVAGLLLQHDESLAGGMILGAGKFTPGILKDRQQKIYIGIGEDDPNLSLSIRARREFSASPIHAVTFEIWPGIGHELPLDKLTPSSESMTQWLRVQAGVANQGEAINWMEKKLSATKKSQDLTDFQKLEIIEQMDASPFANLLDSEGKAALAEESEKLKSEANVKNEQEARAAFFKVMDHESQDRFVSTLAECNAEYLKISTAFPDTVYGKRAAKATRRISKTLGVE